MLVNLFDGAKDAVVFPDDSTFFYMYHPRYSSDQFTNEEAPAMRGLGKIEVTAGLRPRASR